MRYKSLLVLLLIVMVANGFAQLTPSNPSSPLTPVTPSTSVTPAIPSTSSSDPSALFFKNILLSDGDSIVVTPRYPSQEYCSNEMMIVNRYHSQIMSAGILKSFDIQRHGIELRGLMESDACGLYVGYPFYYRLYGLFFNDYFRSLIKVKAVREYGYQVLGDMLVDFCSYFPKDFKIKLDNELKDLLKTIKKCKKHRYDYVIGEMEEAHLYVDGRERDDIGVTMEGMVARRICKDNIPASELEEFVSSLLSRLKSVDTENNPEVLYKVTINNELSYCIGIQGPYFISEKNRKKTIPFVDEDMLLSSYYGQKVYCNYGSDGRYYKICNQIWSKGEWKPLPYYYKDTREILLNAEGALLYRN